MGDSTSAPIKADACQGAGPVKKKTGRGITTTSRSVAGADWSKMTKSKTAKRKWLTTEKTIIIAGVTRLITDITVTVIAGQDPLAAESECKCE